MDNKATFAGYAILELMGHRRLGGYVRETSLGGAPVLRIDIPKADAACWKTTDEPTPKETDAVQFYGGSALFCMTPCTAAMARAVAVNTKPVDLTFYEQETLREDRQLPEGQPPVDAELVS